MIKVGIVGCAGRMGLNLAREVIGTPDMTLIGGTERPGGDAVGRDIALLAGMPANGVIIGVDPKTVFERADVVMDFTTPEATVQHAALAAETRTAHVIGTTGLSGDLADRLRECARRAPIVWAANYSIGVTLLTALAEEVARSLDPAYDIEIVEMHHRHKVDAPSGTALALGRAAAKGREVALEDVWRKTRDGIIGPRPEGEIGFATLRGGDVAGDHSVIFAGDGERLELTHRASSRQVFVKGAIRAVRWVAGKPAGLYAMTDVLGLTRR